MIKIYNMDVMKALKKMPDESVDMQITSPPYWGLRDYGEGTESIWDEDKSCEHEWTEHKDKKHSGTTKKEWEKDMSRGIRGKADWTVTSGFCSKCSAWKGQLGLEPDFNLYIKHLADIFDEVKRVLKKDGTCWVNLGDTYFGGGGGNQYSENNKGIQADLFRKNPELEKSKGFNYSYRNKFKFTPRCLCGIPERFMIEMINRGWVLRNVIIWFKRNHMPTSVKNRFANSWEFLFFFCKSNQKSYKNYIIKDDARWLAGIIDGEGTISIHKRTHQKSNEKRKNPTYGLMLQVSNTDKNLIDEIKRITKVGSVVIREETKEGYKKQWRWCAMGTEARAIIEQCYPYFIVKKQQASASLCLETKRKQAEEIFQEVKKLNQREIDKTSFTYNLPNIKPEKYYFDLDAVRVPHKTSPIERNKYNQKTYGENELIKPSLSRNREAGTLINPKGKNPDDIIQEERPDRFVRPDNLGGVSKFWKPKLGIGKNPSDFWDITTRGYKEAHFAVFPEALVERPIKTTPQQICNKCGKARERITKPTKEYAKLLNKSWTEDTDKDKKLRKEIGFKARTKKVATTYEAEMIGWTNCGCNAGFHPAIIMDIFAGSGTTLKVARDNDRDSIGIEIKKEYVDLIKKRLMFDKKGNRNLYPEPEVIT